MFRRASAAVLLALVLGSVAGCESSPNAASIDRCENFRSWDDPTNPTNCY